MNCPFQNLTRIKDSAFFRTVEVLAAGGVCPNKAFCNPCDCLRCPYFPDALREHLLSIEMKMVKTHQRALPRP